MKIILKTNILGALIFLIFVFMTSCGDTGSNEDNISTTPNNTELIEERNVGKELDLPSADKSSKVIGTIIIPENILSFDNITAEIKMWEYDPFLADASAGLFESLFLKPLSHVSGKKNEIDFSIGELANNGKQHEGKKYYLSIRFYKNDTDYVYWGECSHGGFCSILTDESPAKIDVYLKELSS